MDRHAKIFVAGGSGLVGSAIVRGLLEGGYTNIISNYHRRTPPPCTGNSSPVIYHQLDLTRQADVEAFFEEEKPEYVFLAAAKVGGILANSTYRAEFIYQNIMIAANIIEAAHHHGVKKLLNLGSSCIYPKDAPQPMKEEYLLSGGLESTNEPYAIAKIAAIKLCRYYNEQYGTNYVSVMPTNLYGPGDNFDLETSHVLPALIRKIRLAKLLDQNEYDLIRRDFLAAEKNKPGEFNSDSSINLNSTEIEICDVLSKYGIIKVTGVEGFSSDKASAHSSVVVNLWGTGAPFREFLHVDDLASAVIFLMKKYDYEDVGEFINIGSGKDLTIKDLALMVREIVGFLGNIYFDNEHPDGTPRKLLDVRRINKLGWKDTISLSEGIERTFTWYLGKCQ